MASLNKKLEYLSPILDKSVSMKELQIQLLSKKQESYYKHPGNLLSDLGQMKAQSETFSLTVTLGWKTFLPKSKDW